MDAEYVRNGVVQIFLEVEPLTGKRHVEAAEHRTGKTGRCGLKGMLVKRYPKAVKSALGSGQSEHTLHCLSLRDV